jgi:hypothetical protein
MISGRLASLVLVVDTHLASTGRELNTPAKPITRWDVRKVVSLVNLKRVCHIEPLTVRR